jgi:hypothetical protein
VSVCGQVQTTWLGGGARLVSGCQRYADDMAEGERMCRQHADERRYAKRSFEIMMSRCTKHWKSGSVHAKGDWCACGVFVERGTKHPWGAIEESV